MTSFPLLLLIVSIFLNLSLVLEILRLKQVNKMPLQKTLFSSLPNPSNPPIKEKVSPSFFAPTQLSTREVEIGAPPFPLTALPFMKEPLVKEGADIRLLKPLNFAFPTVREVIEDKRMALEQEDFLKGWLKKSQNGFNLLNYSNFPAIFFNPVLLDIETNDSQLVFGFYFTSLNTSVQLLVDADYSPATFKKLQRALTLFFQELSTLSEDFQDKVQELRPSAPPSSPSFRRNAFLPPSTKAEKIKAMKKKKENEKEMKETIFFSFGEGMALKEGVVFSFLSGYNINNFDLPILEVFLNTNPLVDNPVVKSRQMALALLSGREKKDFSLSTPLFLNFIFLDLLWYTGGRLRGWIDVLNKSNLFPPLKPKNWDNSRFKKVTGMRVEQWLDYNLNDLKATYYLLLFQNSLSLLFSRMFDLFQTSPLFTFVDLFRNRKLYPKYKEKL